MHLVETELFEPTRGSRTEISMLIEAVHHYGLRPIKHRRFRRCHRFQRQRASTRQMFLNENRMRQHIDKLRTSLHKDLGTGNIDTFRHAGTVPELAHVNRFGFEGADRGCQAGCGEAGLIGDRTSRQLSSLWRHRTSVSHLLA